MLQPDEWFSATYVLATIKYADGMTKALVKDLMLQVFKAGKICMAFIYYQADQYLVHISFHKNISNIRTVYEAHQDEIKHIVRLARALYIIISFK